MKPRGDLAAGAAAGWVLPGVQPYAEAWRPLAWGAPAVAIVPGALALEPRRPQIAFDPVTNPLIDDRSIEAATRRVLDNLEAAGLRMSDIVITTVFLAELNEFGRMNAVYATYFPANPPARTTMQVARLPRDARVEIAATAARQ